MRPGARSRAAMISPAANGRAGPPPGALLPNADPEAAARSPGGAGRGAGGCPSPAPRPSAPGPHEPAGPGLPGGGGAAAAAGAGAGRQRGLRGGLQPLPERRGRAAARRAGCGDAGRDGGGGAVLGPEGPSGAAALSRRPPPSVEPSRERREAVKRKITQYLRRAEEIFTCHLQRALDDGSPGGTVSPEREPRPRALVPVLVTRGGGSLTTALPARRGTAASACGPSGRCARRWTTCGGAGCWRSSTRCGRSASGGAGVRLALGASGHRV